MSRPEPGLVVSVEQVETCGWSVPGWSLPAVWLLVHALRANWRMREFPPWAAWLTLMVAGLVVPGTLSLLLGAEPDAEERARVRRVGGMQTGIGAFFLLTVFGHLLAVGDGELKGLVSLYVPLAALAGGALAVLGVTAVVTGRDLPGAIGRALGNR